MKYICCLTEQSSIRDKVHEALVTQFKDEYGIRDVAVMLVVVNDGKQSACNSLRRGSSIKEKEHNVYVDESSDWAESDTKSYTWIVSL